MWFINWIKNIQNKSRKSVEKEDKTDIELESMIMELWGPVHQDCNSGWLTLGVAENQKMSQKKSLQNHNCIRPVHIAACMQLKNMQQAAFSWIGNKVWLWDCYILAIQFMQASRLNFTTFAKKFSRWTGLINWQGGVCHSCIR